MSSLTASDEILDSPEYSAAFCYIANESNPADALDSFCQPVEDKLKSGASSEDVESLLWRAWKSVTAIAASAGDTDAKDQKLAEFVLKLQQRQSSHPDVQDMKLWTDLPIFGQQVRESWNTAANDKSSDVAQREWLNLNSWAATLVESAHSSSNDQPDLSLQGIWTIRMGLEDEEKPANIAVTTAATWIAHAGKAIAEFSKQNKAFDGKLARPGALFNDKEWRGYSQERLQSWLKRLQDLKTQVSDEKQAEIVQRAFDAVNKY